MATYEYKCINCAYQEAISLTFEEYSDTTNFPECPVCGKDMKRVWSGISTQIKQGEQWLLEKLGPMKYVIY